MSDPFEMLGIEKRFDLDLSVVEKQHRELSRALHPDRYAQAGASERRAALEKAASVNEAWRAVRDPIRRAEALFEAHGVPVGDGHEPKASPDFLMDVLEQREALSDARAAKDLVKVTRIGETMTAKKKAAEQQLARGFASADSAAIAKLVPVLGELRFYKRFLDEVSAIEEDNE